MHWAVRSIRDALRLEIGYAGGTVTLGDFLQITRHLLRGTSVTDGPFIEGYHDALRRYLGVDHVFSYGAGRMAFYALLRAMNLNEDDEIILPGYNCVVIPNAIRFAGLKPVYVDIRAHDFNIDPDRIESAITPRTKAIVVQHTFGIACDMDALTDIAGRTGLPLIEDCAHALGATWDGRRLGTIAYAGFYSTEATKMFSTEKGGILVTSDGDLAARIRETYDSTPWRPEPYEKLMAKRFAMRCLRNRPWVNLLFVLEGLFEVVLHLNLLRKIANYDATDYRWELEGKMSDPYPCRLGNLMALAGTRQLARFDRDLAHRRMLAADLERILPEMGAQIPRYDHHRAAPSWVRFPFVVANREAWQRKLRAARLQPGQWLNDPIHPKGSNTEFVLYNRGACPVAERIAQTILNVPLHGRVSQRTARRMAER